MISEDEIKKLVAPDYKGEFSDKKKRINKELLYHSKGVYPKELLDKARPNELDIHKKYREASYHPITKGYYDKILTQIKKIRRAEDWKILWGDDSENNPLRDYTEEKYPEFGSLTNWLFSYGADRIIEDPNGVLLVLPREIEEIIKNEHPDNVELNPVISYISVENIIAFTEDLLAVRMSDDKFLFFDKEETVLAERKYDKNKNITFSYQRYRHSLGTITAVKTGGRYLIKAKKEVVYESFISPVIPHWNEALERQSDHQVNMVLHLHPDRWEYATSECSDCKGKGYVKTAGTEEGVKSENTTCSTCYGIGKVSKVTPFNVKIMNPTVKTGPDDTVTIPAPPAGYINRPIESIDFLRKELDKKILEGFSSVNMEFLMKEPLNQSGRAKEYDREELNTFIYTIAAHLTQNILIFLYRFINEWRYNSLESREGYLPIIQTPAKFDLISADVWRNRIAGAKESGINTSSIRQMEIEFAKKEFGEESTEFKLIRESILLDPLYGLTQSEKDDKKLNDGCSHSDYVISAKIQQFIMQAIEEKGEQFFALKFNEKNKLMKQYSKETIEEINTSSEYKPVPIE